MHFINTGINILYGVRANDISIINSGLINRCVRCRYSDELISRASSFNLSGWDIQKNNYMLSAICREWVVFVFHSSRLMFFFSFMSLTFCVLIFVYLSCTNKDNNITQISETNLCWMSLEFVNQLNPKVSQSLLAATNSMTSEYLYTWSARYVARCLSMTFLHN